METLKRSSVYVVSYLLAKGIWETGWFNWVVGLVVLPVLSAAAVILTALVTEVYFPFIRRRDMREWRTTGMPRFYPGVPPLPPRTLPPCRICRDREGDRVWRPCGCSVTVHLTCLVREMVAERRTTCRGCGYSFNISPAS